MKFLLIGGQPNTGKSETIARLFLLLSKKYPNITNAHTIPTNIHPPTNPLLDFSVLLTGFNNLNEEVKILIHSPTDDKFNIDLLENNIKKFSPDIVITSIRDLDWQRDNVLKIVDTNFHLEIPLARITRRKNSNVNNKFNTALDWYRDTVDNTIERSINQAPFNLV